MGQEFACPVAHSEHGLHFEAEILDDPSGGLPTNKKLFLVVEFNGVALITNAGVVGFMDYQSISGWAHSESNHRLTFKINGQSGAEHAFTFRVASATSIEAAVMSRISVFLDDNKFHAIPLNDPTGRNLMPEEASLTINHQGISLSDPTGAKGNVGFLFSRMESWGEGSGGSILSIKMPQGVFQFSTEDASTIVRKLSEVAEMMLHAEHGHEGSHSSGAPPPNPGYKVQILVDPLGIGLPEHCLMKVTEQAVKIMGRGTKDSCDIRLTSIQQWGISQGCHLTLTLTPEKGSHVFTFDCRTQEVTEILMAMMQSAAEALAQKTNNHGRGVPPPPQTHPSRDAHEVESSTTRQLKITIPKGVKSGNTIVINDKVSGTKIKVKVPKGMRAGNIMTINIKKKAPTPIDHHNAGVTPHHDHDDPHPHHQVDAPETQQKTLKITIPKGVKPGNKINVNLPDGRKLSITVPKGMKPGNVMTINYEEKKKKPPPPPPSSSNSSPPPPSPPPSSRDQFVVVTVPPGEGPGSKLKATFHGNTFVITVPDGVSPGQKIKVKVPFKPPPPRASDAPPPPPPPMLSQKHTISKWPNRTIEQVRSATGGQLSTADVLELLDMADGDVNRAVNMYLNKPGKTQRASPRRSVAGTGGLQIPIAQPTNQAMPPSGPPTKEQKTIKITIPNGVKPGNKINVNLPDGRKLSITVPKGMKPGNVMKINYEQTAAAPRVPVATPIATPIATPVVHHAPPPPPAPPAPPLSPPSSNGTKTAAKRSSTAKGSHDMEFKARSYACNEEFGFPENVTLSLARGHFTVLDEDKDDLASWPMNHVHDWSATGKHDIEVHVPEGTLEFGIEDPETFLTKLSIIHSALSGE